MQDRALGAIPGVAAPLLALPGDAPTKVLCSRMAAARCCWQSAGKSLPGGCPHCLRAAATTAGAGRGSGPCHGERIQGFACPGFQIWGGVQTCQGAGINGPAPPAGLCRRGCCCPQHLPRGLCPGFSTGSGGQRGRCPRNTALLGTAAESPPLRGRGAAPACVGGWKLQPPAPGSCRAGGCGRMVTPP